MERARWIFGPLGGVVLAGAVNATGTWELAEVSMGEFLARRRDDVQRLMDGIRSVCRFDDEAMAIADELGWFRDYEVAAAYLALYSGNLAADPEFLDRLDEPPVVRRMCRMAVDLQLTEFLGALIGVAARVEAEEEAGPGAERIVDVLALACDLADATGTTTPAQVFRMWRVAQLPGILDRRSPTPAYLKAGFRAYDEALEALLVGDAWRDTVRRTAGA
ncbi:hypothetical protein HLK59_23915 [Streptomyces sp. S3(2020)]|uniref:hypothetical protein n=1 Tax=Streptomyces sp. S3(2020) TaxID=2732044 RepID=UPI001489C1C1|nr:hypothetical protein [Streptomyces sp. S3(2020)]NNN33351.1 hypothetical protein [Streptomyces sp. S3(2020)]